MRVQVISDLHREFGFDQMDFAQADVVVFAGDIDHGTRGIEWMKETLPHKTIIYVLGNHEYYKGAHPKTLQEIREHAHGSNVHVLENRSIEIGEVAFHGATLWTDFSLLGNPKEYGMICQNKMNDYQLIRRTPSYSKLRTIDTFHFHSRSVAWLEMSLRQTTAKVNVVVTHHAPSIRSLPVAFRKNPLASAYASNLEDLIQQHQPQFWIHGHIHTPTQYSIGATRVICNPHGYLNEEYNGHQKEFIVEIKPASLSSQ